MKKKIIVVISAKKKSRRLFNKNILLINKLPMFLLVAKELAKSKKIDRILVSSDSNYIEKLAKLNNFFFIKRPRRLTYERVEKQDVVVHAVKKFEIECYKPDIVISVQPNSPEIRYKDIDNALNFFDKKLYPGAKIKELISVGYNNIQNAAFRIMTYNTIFQKTLSTKIGVFFCDYIDIHNKKEYLEAKKKIEKKN